MILLEFLTYVSKLLSFFGSAPTGKGRVAFFKFLDFSFRYTVSSPVLRDSDILQPQKPSISIPLCNRLGEKIRHHNIHVIEFAHFNVAMIVLFCKSNVARKITFQL